MKTKKTYLELQFYKFVRLNKTEIKREYRNCYYFTGVGVKITFNPDGNYVNCCSIPFCVVGRSMDVYVTSIPELIYKLFKNGFLPITLTDYKYTPFNYSQTQLKLFDQYEHKLNDLRRQNIIALCKNDLTAFKQAAISNTKLKI